MENTTIFYVVFSLFINLSFEAPFNFDDGWEYQLAPHNTPLLNESNKIHILPPTESLKKFNEITDKPNKLRMPKILGDAVRSKVSCPVCKLGVTIFAQEIIKGTKTDEIRGKFIELCVAFKIETEDVCTGIFNVFGVEVIDAFNAASISPNEICNLVLGETCGDLSMPSHEWTVTLPDTPKPIKKERTPIPKEGLPTFKVLHISDTHYDPDYMVGSPSNCEEPLCCRANSTVSKKEKNIPAGKWGSYSGCDSPRILIENILKHISDEHPDIDYIMWTGDLPPHDIWKQSREYNLNIIQDTVEMMLEYFPDTPIFPAIGNHESVPCGSFAPPWMKDEKYSVDWLYTAMADHWRKWLPADSEKTVLHGAFYSILIRTGFRIIALNTNYCHSFNWWLLVNSTDPAKELSWLIHELQEAENKGEKVHIIGHIPPGSFDCMKVWSENFYKIVERYEDTIMGQFYGHSHADEFEVFYDMNDYTRATGVAYLGPSVTTYSNYNPAYRIYYIDGDHAETTREILDHETWTMNLDEANQDGNEPEWYRLYSAKSAFGMDSLRPEEWAKLIENLIKNPNLFEIFYKFYYRNSPTSPPCSDKCKLQILCDLKSGRSHYKHHLCHDLELTFGQR